MKIAVLVHSLDGIGGIAKHALCVAREYTRLGHEVSVWAVEWNREGCYPRMTADMDVRALRGPATRPGLERTARLPGLRMAAYLAQLGKYTFDQSRLADQLAEGNAGQPEYDVINPVGNLVSWAAAGHKRAHGTPVVWMCCDFWPPASHAQTPAGAGGLPKVADSVKAGLVLPFERHDRKCVRAADEIVVLSERVKAQMAGHYGVGSSIVRAGVEIELLQCGDGARVRARYGIPASSFVLLTVALLMPRRRIEDVIRALRLLVDEGRDVRYLLVGGTYHSPEYVQALKAEIVECGLSEKVIFAGEVPDDELADHYQACDAFVWAADENQSWGMAGLEALAAKRPLIVSGANGLAEALENGKTALVTASRSPQDIATAVRRLSDEPGLATSIARQGAALVNARYSWRSNAEQMLSLFERAGAR
jgi:glycosyltransferase involved in cell wall biosynthesis